jgi:hypothetical protein
MLCVADADTNTILKDKVVETSQNYWLGFSDKQYHDDFVWVSSCMSTYENWYGGSPSHDGGPHVGATITNTGQWMAQNIHDNNPCACQYLTSATFPTSYPSVAALQPDGYEILSLDTSGAVSSDVSDIVGSVYGNIAVSGTHIFVSAGDDGVYGLNKNTLSMESFLPESNFSLVANLADQSIYMLGDVNGYRNEPGGEVDCLIPLHSNYLGRDEARRIVWLTESFRLSAGSMVYSGYNQVAFMLSSTLETLLVNLRNGRVMPPRRRAGPRASVRHLDAERHHGAHV